MGVIAASGGGKTNFICELIHRMSGTFVEIVICLRTKHEPLYEMLEHRTRGMVKFFENIIPPLDDFKDKEQRLIIFDDLILDKKLQVSIAEYMIRSRKYNISCAYLSQSFYGIPKIIRQQFNYLVLKKLGNLKDIKMIIRDYSLGVNIDDLMRLYRHCIQDKLHFLLLDLNNSDYKYRYCFEPLDFKEE